MLSPVLLVLASVAWLLTWFYFFCIRFPFAILLEWVVGKPILLGFLGAASLIARWGAPGLAVVFRTLTWPLVKLTG